MIITGPEILTRSGLYVNPLDMKAEQVRVEDVAHSLSNQCRFTGHVHTFYSVAEHSVRVVRFLRRQGHPLETLQWGLIHDASEAYLVDIPRPLKVDPYFGKAYRGAEGRAQAVVCEAFGLPHKMPTAVKQADLVLLATERRDLMPPGGDWAILEGVHILSEEIRPWGPRAAKRRFMHEYNRLFTSQNQEGAQ